MKRLATLAALAGVLAVAAPANAQSRMMNPDCNIICSPVFVLQPGVIITNFISQPTDNEESNTEFLLRFTTAFGTQFNPLFFAFLVQWTPSASPSALTGTEGSKANSLVLVAGPGFHVLGGGGAFLDMGGASRIFALDLLPLGVYTLVSSAAVSESDYTWKLALEADFFFNFGKLIDPNNKAPYINGSNIYVILDYITSWFGDINPPDTPSEFEASRWVLLIGATLPFAPIPGG